MDNNEIIIVDESDKIIGSMEKMTVHRKGILHRAFSVLIFDGSRNMLLQKRSADKYHSPLLWSNACCSHQRAGETLEEAVHRRLYEELKINDIKLSEIFTFHYRCPFENSLIENEIDHVYVGKYSGAINEFNAEEIGEIAWIDYDRLKKDVPVQDKYTYWFKLIIQKMGGMKYAGDGAG